MRLSRSVATIFLCLLALGAAASPAGAQDAGGGVRVGAAPPLPTGAMLAGTVAPETELHLYVALEPRDPAGLEAFATEVSTPGSPVYRDFLSVSEFASRFGATPAQIATVTGALAARGLQVGAPSANGLSLPVTATAATAETAFATPIDRIETASGRPAFANRSAPRIPAAAAPLVAGVFGLDDLDLRYDHLARPSAAEDAPSPSPRAAATTSAFAPGPQPCETARRYQQLSGAYTPDQIAAAYRFDDLYAAGDLGAGQSVALLEFEPYLPSDIATYQACYGTAVPITDVNVRGGPGPYRGEDGEASLDIEQLIGLAPAASIIVYQAPNGGGSEIEALSAWVDEDRAKVMSSSWGICEPTLAGSRQFSAVATLLTEAATQGQSFFVASGDSGSTDCYQARGNHSQALAVDAPSDQPFAISVGGTRLEEPTGSPIEYLWNEGLSGGAGGGGVSSQFAMPSYQSSAPAGLNVVGALSSGATCGASTYCRQVPDVAADASPATGYLVFSEEQWNEVGGTSASAPLWAALAALINSSAPCSGRSIGFADPALYAVAGAQYGSYFRDITAGRPGGLQTTNMFSATAPFAAGPGYDMATGIGAPIATSMTTLCSLLWSPPVKPAPARVRHAHLLGVANGRLRLVFSLAAREGGRLDTIMITPPPGLVPSRLPWALTAAIIVRDENGKRIKFSAHTKGRTIHIRLASSSPGAQLTLGPPALTATPKLVAKARSRRATKIPLLVAVRESGEHGTRFPLSLAL